MWKVQPAVEMWKCSKCELKPPEKKKRKKENLHFFFFFFVAFGKELYVCERERRSFVALIESQLANKTQLRESLTQGFQSSPRHDLNSPSNWAIIWHVWDNLLIQIRDYLKGQNASDDIVTGDSNLLKVEKECVCLHLVPFYVVSDPKKTTRP